MAVEFNLGSERRLAVKESILTRLSSTAEELRTKGGLDLDWYSTFTISPGHAALWANGLRRALEGTRQDSEVRKACASLLALLEEAVQQQTAVLVQGE